MFRYAPAGTGKITWQSNLYIKGDSGNVGIGTNNPTRKLHVKGEVRGDTFSAVSPPSWPDFVFEKDYKLRSLETLERYVAKNKHLPGIPNKAEVKANGLNLPEMDARLLQKIEELTLYIIDQNKKIKVLEKTVGELSKK